MEDGIGRRAVPELTIHGWNDSLDFVIGYKKNSAEGESLVFGFGDLG